MAIVLGFLAVTGALFWAVVLWMLLRPAVYALAATVSLWRCWRAAIRRNALKVPFFQTFQGLGGHFVAFYGNPTPGNITMAGDFWAWRGIGDWNVRIKAVARTDNLATDTAAT